MPTGDTKLHRIRPFYGGISTGERDVRVGVGLNFEELDVFSNPDYVEPETIFATDGSNISAGAWDMTDDGTSLYAIGSDGGGTPAPRIWKRASGITSGLGSTDWGSGGYFTDTGQTINYDTFLECHQWADGTKHLYYIVGTNTLRKYGDIAGSPSVSSVSGGTMTGVSGAGGRLPTIVHGGLLYIGHGPYIAKVASDGTYTNAAWTAPTGWTIVDFTASGDSIAVLCKSGSNYGTTSNVYYWDTTATTGWSDSVQIPTGNPQMIVNHGESIRVFAVSNTTTTGGVLRIYELLGKKPYLTHQLDSIDCDYDTPSGAFNYSVSPRTKCLVNNVLYFGVARTTNAGIYALGQARDDLPLALVLSRRCHTTSYANHYPVALYAVGRDMAMSFYDSNASATWRHMVMAYATATRSSNAKYESIFIDDGKPETSKRWDQFLAITAPLPTSCAVAVSARADDYAGTYGSSAHDSATFNTAAKTYHTKTVVYNGKAIQMRALFTSNGTDKARLYMLGVRSTDEGEKQATH